MARRKKKNANSGGSRDFRLRFEDNAELDALKLARAFLALQAHKTRSEAEREQRRDGGA